ncbi:hypothetical protein AArcCO_2231 [Halalkaliarchaeum sp. AArc-CO]|nr:hypothetical protein AArcCO_2231 [Halalkaliarchaeum sp. AArc-CO]
MVYNRAKPSGEPSDTGFKNPQTAVRLSSTPETSGRIAESAENTRPSATAHGVTIIERKLNSNGPRDLTA